MKVLNHRNFGAVGHRLMIEYPEDMIEAHSTEELKAMAEKDAIAYCQNEDGYPDLKRTDPRRLISQGLRAKPDADGIVRRFTVWVRPFSRKAASPWAQEADIRREEAGDEHVSPLREGAES